MGSSSISPPCPTSRFPTHSPFLSSVSGQLLLPHFPQIPSFNLKNHSKMSPITSTLPAPPNRRFFNIITNPNLGLGGSVIARSQLNSASPLISPDDHWGIWTALFSVAAFGRWSEKTKIGSMVSVALVSILIGQAASNLRILPYEATVYSIVMRFLLPLSIPLLLFRADMRQVIQSTGRLLIAFLIGSVATMIGTVVAYFLVPMRSLGSDGWKIAAALMGSYIGGTVNYIAICEVLGVSSSVVSAGVAADNVICAIYFIVLFALASKVPPEPSKLTTEVEIPLESTGKKIRVLPTATAIAISFAICKSADFLTKMFGLKGAMLPIATAVTVALATQLPSVFSYLALFAEPISLVLMQVFFVVIGAGGNIRNVINTAPSIFLFALVQVSVHLGVILGIGTFFGFELKLLLLASNANIGGPTTACGMATAKRWEALIVPGILVGIFGISIATFLGIALGLTVLKHM